MYIREGGLLTPQPDPNPAQFLHWEKKSFHLLSHGLSTPDTNTGQRDAEKTTRTWAWKQHERLPWAPRCMDISVDKWAYKSSLMKHSIFCKAKMYSSVQSREKVIKQVECVSAQLQNTASVTIMMTQHRATDPASVKVHEKSGAASVHRTDLVAFFFLFFTPDTCSSIREHQNLHKAFTLWW